MWRPFCGNWRSVVKFAQSAIFKQKQKIRVFFEIDAAMLKRFAEAGVAVFQNRSTVDKFVHCQGISGNIKMMCWSKKTCSCHWRKTNGCKHFANKRWNRGETNPFLTHPDHVQTLWNKKIKKIWQLSNWRKQTAAKLEKNLERILLSCLCDQSEWAPWHY